MVENVNSANFFSFVKSGLVLIDFSATWCGPCKMLAPHVEQASNEYEGKLKCGKIDIDESTDLADKYDVYAVPYLMLFKDGKEVAKSLGYIDYAALKQMIDKNL